MKKWLSGLLILTMTIYLLFSGGFIFSKDLPICIFGAVNEGNEEKEATSSVASLSSAVGNRPKRKTFPRFRLILESEEIFCGENAKATISGLLETDELTFRIKKSDSSIEDMGDELEFDEFSDDGTLILYTDKLEADSWQLMAVVTRANNSASMTCDLVTVEREVDSDEENSFSLSANDRNSSAFRVSSNEKRNDSDLIILKISASYIGEGVWITDGKNWKLLTSFGVFAANQWAFIGGRWYVFDSNGNMLVGWQNINQKWYFMNKDGAMATGWILVDQKWYYLASSGEMYASATTPDGYQVNADGEWVVDGIVQIVE